MKVLVCGDRNWPTKGPKARLIYSFLYGLLMNHLHSENKELPFVVIEGGANGADKVAKNWATFQKLGAHPEVQHMQFTANWDKYGKAAGPIRNQQMLNEGKPEIVLAFHGDIAASKGTKHMVKIAKEAGIETYVIG